MEELEWSEHPIGVKGVKGEGFFVHSGFNFAVYQEGERSMKFPVSRGLRRGAHLMTIPLDAFDYWAHSSLKNSRADQQRMRANFIAAMLFAGINVE